MTKTAILPLNHNGLTPVYHTNPDGDRGVIGWVRTCMVYGSEFLSKVPPIHMTDPCNTCCNCQTKTRGVK